MKLRPFFKADKKEAKVKKDPCVNETSRRALLFLAKGVYHVFQRAGAFKGLCDEDKAFHISRLVSQTRRGLTVVKGHAPQVGKAKQLAKAVLKELQQEYGAGLKHHLLDTSAEKQAVVVFCLRRHARRMFAESCPRVSKDDLLAMFIELMLIPVGVVAAFALLMFTVP